MVLATHVRNYSYIYIGEAADSQLDNGYRIITGGI